MTRNIRTGVKSFPETRKALQQVKECVLDLLARLEILEVPPTTGVGAPIRRLTLLADTNKAQQYSLRPAATASIAAAVGELLRCDTDGGGFTVTLPVIDSHMHGDEVVVKNIGTSLNDVTVAAGGSDTIDGGASVAVADGIVATFVSDGSATWVQV